MSYYRRAAVLLMVLAVVGCIGRGGYYRSDGPPARHKVNVANIPDAVPRHEPLSATGNRTYRALGNVYHPLKSGRGYHQRGIASWYGKMFHGRRTSSGERYDMYAMTAAHPTLPLPSYVRVRNLRNGKSVVVRINDRGPFRHNRIIDLSYAAAYRLGIVGRGTGAVEIETVFPQSTALAASAPVSTALPVARVDPTRMFIQVGAFADPRNAYALRNRLLVQGFNPVSIHSENAAVPRLYRVRVGPIASVEEAGRQLGRINGVFVETPRLVIE